MSRRIYYTAFVLTALASVALWLTDAPLAAYASFFGLGFLAAGAISDFFPVKPKPTPKHAPPKRSETPLFDQVKAEREAAQR